MAYMYERNEPLKIINRFYNYTTVITTIIKL